MTTSPVRSIRAAFWFLTRLPVGGFPFTNGEWRWAPAHFPLVGGLLGVALAILFRALLPIGAFGAALLTMGCSLLFTGALHEDGLADTSDALGGAFERDKVLTILKDARIGAFGACALVLSIGGRAALLGRMGQDGAWALPLVGAVARVGPIWQMVALPYVTAPDVARGRHLANIGLPQAFVATLWSVAIAGGLVAAKHVSLERAAIAFLCAAVVTILAGARYMRRVGGITGDFLGATEQICELAVFAVLAWGQP
jgi:adenosylcobinamide-GDP ribazoletransferase